MTGATRPDPVKAKKHGVIARLLHWSTAGLLTFAFIANSDVTGALRDPRAMATEAVIGILIAALFAVRYWWMQTRNGGATRLPASTPKWERALARLWHLSLYLAVFAIVATGLLIPVAQIFGGRFWVRQAVDLHLAISLATLALIAVHVVAALWHQFVRGDGILAAMLPGFGWLSSWRRASASTA